jgi:hypothetical protein
MIVGLHMMKLSNWVYFNLKYMNKIFLSSFLLLSTLNCFSQLESVPYNNGQIVYEKVIYIDSVNDRNIVFNSAKAALIKNTNYKYTKIDEDRNSGNITTQISFLFNAKPGIIGLAFSAVSNLSIDVKENRFRIRLYNNNASLVVMNQKIDYDILSSYLFEKEKINQGKWIEKKSVVLPWDKKLNEIFLAFASLVKEGVNDEF